MPTRSASAGLVVALSFLAAACSPAGPSPLAAPSSVAGPQPGQPASVSSDVGFRLTGTVLDAAWGDPLPGARVEVLVDATVPPIAIATAGSDGTYSLSGVPVVSDIRVTHEGYLPTTTRLELSGHGSRNFSMTWDSTDAFAGAYTLTIEADHQCPSAPHPLPAHLRRRSFPAEIHQAGSRLTVSVGSPCYRSEYDGAGCRLTGRASASGATFLLTAGEDRGFLLPQDLIERLGTSVDLRTGIGDFSGLLFLGVATTNIVANGLAGHFAGTITLHSNIFPAPVGPGTAGCGGGRFELTGR